MDHGEFVRLLVQLAVLLAAATVLGRLAERLRAPAVVGELAAGLLLGPTVLGAAFPNAHAALFVGGSSEAARAVIGRLGLLAFVFVAGLELQWSVLRRRARALAWTAGLGMALPFVSGAALGWSLAGDPALSPQSRPVFALMLGTALSISALPVIARILFGLGLSGTETATLVLAAASIDDWIGWCLFGVVAGLAGTAGRPTHPAAAVAAAVLLTSAALLVVRPAVRAMRRRGMGGVPGQLGAAAAASAAAAALAEALGTHALFGVFLLGACFAPGGEQEREPVRDALQPFVTGVLAPLYFAEVGLGIDLGRHFDPGLTVLLLVVGTVGKVVGAGLGARLGGLPPRQALAIGAAMNARGAMEIVLASAARASGLIGESVYVALIVLALATSLAAGPCLARLLPVPSRRETSSPGEIPSPT